MNESTTNALAIRDPKEIAAIGELFETSGMFGCTQKGQGTVLAMTCLMTGKSPIEINQTYHIIEGKLSMKAETMLAKFVERGGRYTIQERSAIRAAATFSTKDNPDYEAEYTMAEAQESGICFAKDGKSLKVNWRQHPKQMLWARLVSDSVRALDPGVNMGTYTPEEIGDFDRDRFESARPIDVPTPMTTSSVTTGAVTTGGTEPEQEEKPKPRRGRPPKAKEEPKPEPPESTEPEADTEPEAPAKSYPTGKVDLSDTNVMPIGRYAGQPWTRFTESLLKQVAGLDSAKHPELTQAHKDAAKAELDSRPEVVESEVQS